MTAPIENRPALGAFLPASKRTRLHQEALAAMRRSINDQRARARAMARLVKVYEGIRTGRRYQLIAADLRHLADAIDRVPQRLLELDQTNTEDSVR